MAAKAIGAASAFNLTMSKRHVPRVGDAEDTREVVIRNRLSAIETIKDEREKSKLKRRLPVLLLTFFLFIVVVFSQLRIHDSYLLDESIRQHVLERPVEGTPLFAKIASLEDYWSWMEKTFIPQMYQNTWYNGDALDADRHAVLYQSYFIGGFRINQRRVRDGTCDKSTRFETFIPHCWGPLSDATESTDAFGPNSKWTHEVEEDGVAGFFEDFGLDRTQAAAKLAELKRERFLDQATRVIYVDFTLFNHNLNMFLVAELEFDITVSGFIRPVAHLDALRIEPYLTPLDDARAAAEIVYMALVVLWVLFEVFDLVRSVKEGRAGAHIFSMWFLWRTVNHALSLAGCAMWLDYLADTSRSTLALPQDEYVSLEHLGWFLQQYTLVNAVNLLFYLGRLLEYLQFNRKVAFVTDTMVHAWPNLWSFLILFFVVFCTYVAMAMLLFGPSLRQFSDFEKATASMFTVLTGESGYNDVAAASPVGAPILYYTFLVLVFLLLLNIFIAVLAEAYLALTTEKAQQAELGIAINQLSGVGEVQDAWAHRRLFDYSDAIDMLSAPSLAQQDLVTLHDMHAAAADVPAGIDKALPERVLARYGVPWDFDHAEHARRRQHGARQGGKEAEFYYYSSAAEYTDAASSSASHTVSTAE